jgi:hypothetical protein
VYVQAEQARRRDVAGLADIAAVRARRRVGRRRREREPGKHRHADRDRSPHAATVRIPAAGVTHPAAMTAIVPAPRSPRPVAMVAGGYGQLYWSISLP